MGFNASWLAVRGKPAESVLDLMRLKRTGEFEEVPESPVTGIALQWTGAAGTLLVVRVSLGRGPGH